MTMTLYGGLASPYVARVVMFARLKGIDLPPESPPGGMGSDEFKRINLTGKIPALMTEQGCIAESEAICEYLEGMYPEPALIPADPLGRAQTKMVSRMTDLYIAPHNTPLRNHKDPASRDQAVVDEQADKFARGFAYLEHFMGPGPFAVAAEPTLGDCALAPFVGMLKQTVFPFFAEIEDPTTGSGRLAEWWQALEGHPACHRAVDEYAVELERFLVWLRDRMAKRGLSNG
jgi:maleylpyruvate isomerase